MTDTEKKRIEAVRRATILRQRFLVYEGDGEVLWPWTAYPIPDIYAFDPVYACALAEATGLVSYLPFEDQVRIRFRAVCARVFAWLRGWTA